MFWTIQHKVVLDAINSDEIYKPDFSLSQKPYGFVGVYSFILNSFNLLNPQLEKGKDLFSHLMMRRNVRWSQLLM